MTPAPVISVVGVGPGLGAAVARRFGRAGFAVALMARSTDPLGPIQVEIEQQGGLARSISVDAKDPEGIKRAFDQVQTDLGSPEVLVYNAGVFQLGGILEISPDQFQECWQVNCMGAFLAAQQVLPAMIEGRRGTILLTGATAALRGSARFACLAVGKFGLRALAQSMAREFGPQGIHVAHVIIDGQIDTPRLRSRSPERDPATLLNPEAIAESYWQLYCQDPTTWTLELDLRPASEKF